MKFYFTYGTDENYPYQGGWTEVEVDGGDDLVDRRAIAENVFRAVHPNHQHKGIINCAFIYDETSFSRNFMCREGNFGVFCHERIRVLINNSITTENAE